MSSPSHAAHSSAVSTISARVRQLHEQKQPLRIYHGSTNSTRASPYTPENIVDTSTLNRVLEVNAVDKTVAVEPNVAMDALVAATLPHALIPPVVMEFPGITCGGGFAGTAGESSSFKHGIFDSTALSIEIVLADGQVVEASESVNSDLFWGAKGSCGTLGVVTKLVIRLIEAKDYVALTYFPTRSVEEAVEKLGDATSQPEKVDYVDGILFAQDRGVIMVGRLADSPPPGAAVQRFTRPRDPWFYLHAERVLAGMEKKGRRADAVEPVTVAVPIADYFFRYDRGAFWGGRHAFRYFLTPFNRITRWLLDPFMHTRVMYHALHESGLADRTIVQDVGFPFDSVGHFVRYAERKLGFYPLWLCPVAPSRNARESGGRSFSMGRDMQADEMLVNVGVWGMGPKDREEFVALNKDMEAEVRRLRGLKCLYAHTYYTEDEFWDIYDREWYEGLRTKWRANGLPSVYDKVKVSPRKEESGGTLRQHSRRTVRGIWPLNGLYGVYKAAKGKDYLIGRK
ncbi:FAD binding domain-containing protein [Saccharata proteae CBS 121410]|uniref:Delta(24)-sterol reductase n=1 Tax=Saccharata proteae CBS 121410 TaxID=1314787 RepID=A0A6A5YBK7_9PEZI|nr:FAD binding domain-containing protein [Saccharata proteae CBS 121410]